MCALRLCVYDDDDDDESYELSATQQLYYALIALVHATETRIVVNISITTLCEQVDSVGFVFVYCNFIHVARMFCIRRHIFSL